MREVLGLRLFRGFFDPGGIGLEFVSKGSFGLRVSFPGFALLVWVECWHDCTND